MAGAALPTQHAPLAGLPPACRQDTGEPTQVVFGEGLSLDATAYPAPARYLATGGPALCATRAPVPLGHGRRRWPGSGGRYCRLLARGLRSRSRWNPVAPLPAVGGKPALHAVEPKEEPVWMDIGERVGHTLVLGTTRVGKTRLAELLITQDIRRGDVVIVFDPKGDADLLRRVYAEAKRAGRLDGLLRLSSGLSRDLRPLQRHRQFLPHHRSRHPDRQPVAQRGQLRRLQGICLALREYHRPRPGGPEATPGLPTDPPPHQRYRAAVCRVRALLRRAGGHRGLGSARSKTLAGTINERNLPASLRGRSEDAIALLRFLQEKTVYDPVLDGLASAFKYDKTYFDKIVSSVGPLMEKLTTGNIAALISPDYQDDAGPAPDL